MDEATINNIEEATRDQSSSEQWKKEHKFRFTASKFDLISKRQSSHEKFTGDLINLKQFTSRYVEHGIKNEPIAIGKYEKIMFTQKTPVKVLKSGFVVCLDMPLLEASPDGRVVNFGCQHNFDKSLHWKHVRIQFFFLRLFKDNADLKGIIPITLKWRESLLTPPTGQL